MRRQRDRRGSGCCRTGREAGRLRLREEHVIQFFVNINVLVFLGRCDGRNSCGLGRVLSRKRRRNHLRKEWLWLGRGAAHEGGPLALVETGKEGGGGGRIGDHRRGRSMELGL